MNSRITNVCASFSCLCILDLFELYISNFLQSSTSSFMRYDPSRFPGLRLRLLDSKTTALIFSSGYISIVGAKSYDNAFEGAHEVVDIFNKQF